MVQGWITTSSNFDFVTGCQEIKIAILMRPDEMLNILADDVSKLFSEVEKLLNETSATNQYGGNYKKEECRDWTRLTKVLFRLTGVLFKLITGRSLSNLTSD